MPLRDRDDRDLPIRGDRAGLLWTGSQPYVCYLVTRQHIPVARVAELLRDNYGAPVATGTIVAMVEEGAAMLEEFLAQVKDLLIASDVAHADETGLRVEAHLQWVHALSSGDLTLYHLDAERGTTAMDAMGVIEHLRGVLVHDGWSSYRTYANLTHGLCNAHHLRDLDAAGSTPSRDRYPPRCSSRLQSRAISSWNLAPLH
jgi:hypothetical protein